MIHSVRTLHRTPHRTRNDQGFTLIELLVVIIILGILAAVVVFAVRGTGDKGRRAAVVTDQRTIRTALDAFCATKGHYPGAPDDPGTDPMDVLVKAKFLSARSEYHVLETGDSQDAEWQGKCQASPTRYLITCADGSDMPDCGTAGDGSSTPTTLEPGLGVGSWALAASPSDIVRGPGIVQLLNGKVLASFDNAETALFDPAIGTTGQWTAGPAIPSEAYRISAMVLIEGPPEQCAPNCGKVLAHFSRHGNTAEDFRSYWALYEPAGDDGVAGTEGKWTKIQDHTAPAVTPNFNAAATQITGTPAQCFPNCGKVFITGDVLVDGDLYATFLYNPKATDPAEMFESLADVEGARLRLKDGRLLFISWNTTTLFDPTNNTFSDGRNTPFPFGGLPDLPVLLPNGDVLVTYQEDSTAPNTGCLFGCNGQPGTAAVYTPDPPGQGPGEWVSVDTCGPRCFVLAALPNGEVLAFSSIQGRRPPAFESQDTTFLYNPTDKTWRDASKLKSNQSAGWGVLLTGPMCGTNCNKVLSAGSNSAELFTLSLPPPPCTLPVCPTVPPIP